MGLHLRHHPRTMLAVKAAVATTIAWLLVQPLWGIADRYPYYAPLGAFIAVGTTVVGSVREALQGLLGILLGAALALGVGLLGVSEVVALGIVVAVGTLLAGWWRMGSKADWVPLTALFVLIIGKADPVDYAIGYLGLTSLGALVGVLVNLALPQLPINHAQTTVSRLRDLLAAQVDDLAEGLLQEEAPSRQEWYERRHAIEPMTRKMRDMVDHATEARRGNWRVQRWRTHADQQYDQARALEQLAFLVQELADLVGELAEHGEASAIGPELRPYAAHAFQDMADLLRSIDGPVAPPDELSRAQDAVDKLLEQVRARRRETGEDLLVAGTVVLTLGRALRALAPADPAAEQRAA